MTYRWGNLPTGLAGGDLPDCSYLDTVALKEWSDMQVATAILERLASAGKVAKMESHVVREIETFFENPIAKGFLKSYLAHVVQCDLSNDLPEALPIAMKIRKHLENIQLQSDPHRPARRSANLGEAATIAYMLAGDPDATFVTRDFAAQEVAENMSLHVARLLAYVTIEVHFGDIALADLAPDGEVPVNAESLDQLEHWMTEDVQALMPV